MDIKLKIIGHIISKFKNREECPKQASFHLPVSYLKLNEEYLTALDGLRVGDEVYIFTWLNLGDRSVLLCHPRGDKNRPKRGVFATRSPDRPNPIGLHRVRIFNIQDNIITIHPMEVINNTPVVDIKPVDTSEFEMSFGPNIDPKVGIDILEIGKKAWEKGFISGFSGNISVKVGDKIVITKSGINKGLMDGCDIVAFGIDEDIDATALGISSEWKMHLEIYKKQKDALAIIHSHPTHLLLAIDKNENFLKAIDLFEADFLLEKLGIVPNYLPGSAELAEAVGEISKTKQIIVLKKHGLVCWGKDLKDAFSFSEEIEKLAQYYMWIN